MPFTINDALFAEIKISQTAVDLINTSPLLASLLEAYNSSGRVIQQFPSKYVKAAYNDDTGSLSISSAALNSENVTDFVRLLSHELGHFYDDQLGGLTPLNSLIDITDREMDESQATAISYIVSRQIELQQEAGNLPLDINIDFSKFVSNKIFNSDIDILSTLDSEFGDQVSSLDAATAEHFAATINQLRGKVTMLFITHALPKDLKVDNLVRIGNESLSVVSPVRSSADGVQEHGIPN